MSAASAHGRVGVERPRDGQWQIWVDTGGTFTDCLALGPDGAMHRAKVLSSGALRGRVVRRVDDHAWIVEQRWGACDDLISGFVFRSLVDMTEQAAWGRVGRFDAANSMIELDGFQRPAMHDGEAFEVVGEKPAPILAARLVTHTPAGQPLPSVAMRLATTRGTNALLQRTGAPTALFITRGFADLLTIGDQQRPDLFALNIIKPPLVHACSVEVVERTATDGSIIQPLDLQDIGRRAAAVLARGIRSAAVALVNSYVNPTHERQVANLLQELGFEHVTCSYDAAPSIKILPRAQTAVVNAYLSPVIRTYLEEVQRHIGGDGHRSSLHVMTSAGSLTRAESFRASEGLLSGPAGGLAGAVEAGRRSGFARIISFDMGGTSTDVARFDGDFEYRFEHSVGGVRLMTPALNIHSVAAGGGSMCRFIDGRLLVGPRSAGSSPGPACYGTGGPLTLTDVNLLLGRLSEDQFEIPLSQESAKAALTELLSRIERHTGDASDGDDLLEGFLDIANQRMSAAIEQISVRQGYDPADHALVAFGGAGGQHACAVAKRLGIATVVLPEDASLLSALGLSTAVIERFAQRQVLQVLDECGSELPLWINALSQRACAAVAEEGVDPSQIVVRRRIVNMRLLGQDCVIGVECRCDDIAPQSLVDSLRMEFRKRYQAMYGHLPAERKLLEVESIRVIAAATRRGAPNAGSDCRRAKAKPIRRARARFSGLWQDVPVFDRAELGHGAEIVGPALVLDRRTSLVVEGGWSAHVDAAGAVIVSRNAFQEAESRNPAGTAANEEMRPSLVTHEIFANRLTSIAIEMGEMLQRTALSVNVKERLDFSCAVMDADGQLVVNAPHIPVHLGSMGMCVRSVRQVIDMRPGDVIVTNHPRHGGTHLPDITVITPVFCDGGELIGYVASRAHHAEIGGTRPGSMPPNATTLVEEGVVISPRHLVQDGRSRFDEMEQLLEQSRNPSRAVEDNLADLQAAVAANERGRAGLLQLAREWGANQLREGMRAISDHGHDLLRDALRGAIAGQRKAVERLDDRSVLSVWIHEGEAGRVVFDFSSTAKQHPGNLNATPAIVHSAVMYVLRLLIGRDVPLNEGVMRAIVLKIPKGSMLNPRFHDDPARCPAVVGGNTETSQRLVDTLLKALDLCACSQGTMNNVLFGNERFGYYETICGGAGAGPGIHGADAVHTHMTNTRITDVEVIEHRYPVRVERFAVRRGSGGDGTWRGGDGVVREIRFLEPMSLSILSQHRVERPFGMHGGEPGALGCQRVMRATGETVDLESIDACEVQRGDRLIVETPGGGGWGCHAV